MVQEAPGVPTDAGRRKAGCAVSVDGVVYELGIATLNQIWIDLEPACMEAGDGHTCSATFDASQAGTGVYVRLRAYPKEDRGIPNLYYDSSDGTLP